MKLLAKAAEERYQTAAGVACDLRRRLREWEAHCRIDPFQLGAHDISDRLLIPEKLYLRQGRAFLFRSQLTAHASQAVRATGVALPPTLREIQ
jgi:hypothetical protein